MSAVILYGPSGSGKTQHAEELRQMYRMDKVIDSWVPNDLIEDNVLYLTQSPFVGEIVSNKVLRLYGANGIYAYIYTIEQALALLAGA